MGDETAATFDSVRALQPRLVREPDARSVVSGLRPRVDEPPAWIPRFDQTAYRAVDPTKLGLGGSEDFHEIAHQRLDAARRHVVDVEGPVHFRVLGERLLDGAGLKRLGSRIRKRIIGHVDTLERAGALVQRGAFIATDEQFRMPRLRDWSALPDKLRDLDYVADTELMLAFFHAVLEEQGISVKQAMNDGIYRMGFIRLTDNARERFQAPLKALLDDEMLAMEDGALWLGWNAFVRQPIASAPG